MLRRNGQAVDGGSDPAIEAASTPSLNYGIPADEKVGGSWQPAAW